MYIIPYPQEHKIREEILNTKGFCVKSDLEFTACLDNGGETQIVFKITDCLRDEAYKISVNQTGIEVLYGDTVGAYRAVSTLKQIIAQTEDGKLNCFEIYDYPSMKNRGYMLDISRAKIPNLKYLKKLVDILADLKYNQLQLYMESFVYEYKNFPEYWKDTEPLTKEEITELDRYCSEHFIELVPNQNCFGHMEVWTQKEELSHLAITKDGKPSSTLNPLLDETIEFVDKIFDGFFDAFTSDKVNVGMDEPFELGLGETKEICDKQGIGKVFTDYLNKVCTLIDKKYNKTPMFWDDIVFKHPEQIDNIPKNAIVMHWGYETEHRFERNCRLINEKGLKFYVCPGTSMWGSFTGRTNNMYFNITNAVESGCEHGAEGFLLTEWGDGGHPQFPCVTYLPLVLGGATSWNRQSAQLSERYEVLVNIKKYLDKYIYKTTSDKSLADIVWHMGNYYTLEDGIHMNTTELWWYKDNQGITQWKKDGFDRVEKYMRGLREELEQVEADEIMLRQAKLGCDMVILYSKAMSGKYDDISKMADNVKKEYEQLWKLDNHNAGVEVYINEINKLVEKARI